MVPLIGALFKDAISSTYRIASNGSPNWRDVQGRGRDVTNGAVVECRRGSQKLRFPILLPPNNFT